MTATPAVLGQRWLAALALDPQGLGGLLLRARASPLRDAWLASALPLLSAHGVGHASGPRPVRKLPHNTPDERLLGGLDVAASIAAGRAITQAGLLAEVDGGVLVAPMAERMTEATAAKLAAALDTGTLTLARDGLQGQLPARFALLALDEGIDDEAAPPAMAERLAFRLNLDALLAERLQDSPQNHAEGHAPQAPETPTVQPNPLPLAQVQVPDALMQAICAAALALGVDSMRPCLQAVRAARAFAALDACAEATETHAREAVEAVLAHRATRLPAPPPEEDAQDPPPPPDDPQANQNPDEQGQPPKPEDAKPLEDQLIEAAQAAIPADLLALLGTPTSRRAGRSGKAGALHRSTTRGRPVGTMATPLKRPPRLNVLATLRSAVPWQKLRTATAHGGIKVERSDFRVTRFAERATTLTVFAVDASGSAALHRLAEAKGAVETLLADCYVRRDEVAVVGFRGHKAELLLPPTRSLVRAKRALSGLPGGGGTPLASGLEASFHVLAAATKRQQTPTLVVLTDGRANIGRNGQPGREQAHQDALLMARHLRAMGARSLLVDTAPQPSPVAREVAAAMGAQYLALPHAQAKLVARAAAELGR